MRNLCFITTDGTNTAYRSFIFDSIIPDLGVFVTAEGLPAQEKTYSFIATDDSEPEFGFVYRHIVIPTSITDFDDYCGVVVPRYTPIQLRTNGGFSRHDVSVDEVTGEDLPLYAGTFTSALKDTTKPTGTRGFRISADPNNAYGTLHSDTDITFGGSRHAWREVAYNGNNGIFYISFFADSASEYVGDIVDDTEIKITSLDNTVTHLDRYFSNLDNADPDSDVGDKRTVFQFKRVKAGFDDTIAIAADPTYNFEVYHSPITFTDEADNGSLICIVTEDSFGNEAWEIVEVQNIDNTDPVITAATDSDGFFAFSNEEGTMGVWSGTTATDDPACDTADNDTNYTPYIPYSSITANDVCYSATDIAGNTSYKYVAADGENAVTLVSINEVQIPYVDDDGNTSIITAPGTFGYQTGITNATENLTFVATNGGNGLTTYTDIYKSGESTTSTTIQGTAADANGNVLLSTEASFTFSEGDWEIYTDTKLSDGVRPGHIKVYDLTIDTTPPATPSSIALDASTDTSRFGLSGGSSDGYTQNEDIRIIGCSEEDLTTSLVINGVAADDLDDVADTDPTPGDGLSCGTNEKKYEIVIPKESTYLTTPTTEGGVENTIETVVTDLASNKSTKSSTVNVTIDSGVEVSSTASIGLTDNTTDITGDSTPTFTVSGVESDSIVEIHLKEGTKRFYLGSSVIDDGDTSVDVTVGGFISGYTSTTGETSKSSLDDDINVIYVNIVDKAGNELSEALSDYTIEYKAAEDYPTFLKIINAHSEKTATQGEVTYYTNKTTDISLTGVAKNDSIIKIYDNVTGNEISTTPDIRSQSVENAWTISNFCPLVEGNYGIYATSLLLTMLDNLKASFIFNSIIIY